MTPVIRDVFAYMKKLPSKGAIGWNLQIVRRLISSAPKATRQQRSPFSPTKNDKPCTQTLENPLSTLHLHSKIIQKSVWRYGHGGNHGSHGGMKTERYWRKSPAADATLSWILIVLWLGCAVCNRSVTADLLASFLASNCCKLKLCSHHTQAKERTVHGMTSIQWSCDVMGNSPWWQGATDAPPVPLRARPAQFGLLRCWNEGCEGRWKKMTNGNMIIRW